MHETNLCEFVKTGLLIYVIFIVTHGVTCASLA